MEGPLLSVSGECCGAHKGSCTASANRVLTVPQTGQRLTTHTGLSESVPYWRLCLHGCFVSTGHVGCSQPHYATCLLEVQ